MRACAGPGAGWPRSVQAEAAVSGPGPPTRDPCGRRGIQSARPPHSDCVPHSRPEPRPRRRARGPCPDRGRAPGPALRPRPGPAPPAAARAPETPGPGLRPADMIRADRRSPAGASGVWKRASCVSGRHAGAAWPCGRHRPLRPRASPPELPRSSPARVGPAPGPWAAARVPAAERALSSARRALPPRSPARWGLRARRPAPCGGTKAGASEGSRRR